MSVLWLLLGDFNQALDVWDKLGGKPVNQVYANRLRTIINRCHLVDLGFQGPRFTWTNGRRGAANIKERLDQAWCNLLWHKLFERANVRHLARTAFDHHPLLLSGLETYHRARFGGFRYIEA